jgi:hypothetical protein
VYYFARGEEDVLLATVRQARERGVEQPDAAELAASVLVGRKQPEAALKILRTKEPSQDTGWQQLIREGSVLAGMPGRREDAVRAITGAIRDCRGGTGLAYIMGYVHLLGPEYLPKARQAALEIRERSSQRLPKVRNGWYHDLLAFHAGLMDDKELLRKAGESQFNQCEGNFYVGLRQLAEGKRGDAKTCFSRAFRTGVLHWGECY